jgi:hypothetical protein
MAGERRQGSAEVWSVVTREAMVLNQIAGNEWTRGEVSRFFLFAQWITIEWGSSVGGKRNSHWIKSDG